MPRPANQSATAAATAVVITNADFEDAAGIVFGDENGERPGAATIDKKTLGAWRFGEEFAKPFQRSLLEERPIPPWSMTRPQLFFLSLLADLSKLCTLTESDIAVVREYVHAHMKTRRSVSFMHGDSTPLEDVEHAEWTLEVRAPRQISSVLMACDGGPPMIVPPPSAKTAAAKELQAQKDAEEAESAPAPTPRGPAHGIRMPLLPEPRPTATTAEDDAKTRPPPAPATATLPPGPLWFKVRMEPSASGRARTRLASKFNASELLKVEFHLPSSPAAAMDDVAASATGGDNRKAPTIAAWSKSLNDYVSKPSKASLAAFLDSCDDHRASTLATVIGQPLRLSFDARQVWEPVCCDAHDVVVRGDAMPTTTVTYSSVPADQLRRWAGLPPAGPNLATSLLDLQLFNTPAIAVRRLKSASDVRMVADLPHAANNGCGRISVSLMSKLVAVYNNQMKKATPSTQQQQQKTPSTSTTLRETMRRVDADLPPRLKPLSPSSTSALEITWRGVRGTVVAVRDDEIGPAGDDKERVFFTRSMVRLDMPTAEAAEAGDRCEVLSQLGVVAVAAHEPVLLSHGLVRLLDANRAVVVPAAKKKGTGLLSTATAGSRRSLTNNHLLSGTVSRANSQRSGGSSAIGGGGAPEGAQDDDGDIDFDDPALIAAAGAAARDRIGGFGNEDIDIDDRPTSFDGNYQGATSKRQSRRSSIGSNVLSGGGGGNGVAATASSVADSEREHDRLEALLTRWLLVNRPDVTDGNAAKKAPANVSGGGSLRQLLSSPETQSAFLRRVFNDSEGHDDDAGEKHPRVRRRFLRHPAVAAYLLQMHVPLPNATNALGVVDFSGVIAPDEVVVPSPSAPGQFITGDVLVTAAALLAPKADQLVRFKAVQPPPSLQHLTSGVIAFSGAGDACAAHQMGATLGGDRFAVLWDSQLVALVDGARPAAGARTIIVHQDPAASPARSLTAAAMPAGAKKSVVAVTAAASPPRRPPSKTSSFTGGGAASTPVAPSQAMSAIDFVMAPVTRRRDVCTLAQLRQLHQRLADAASEDSTRFRLAADRVADLVARAVTAPARGSWVTWPEVRRVLPTVVPRVPHYSAHVACRRKRRHSGSLNGCLYDRFVTAMLNRPVAPAELLESGVSVLSAFNTHPFRMGCVHGLGEDGNYLAKMIEEPERTYERLESYADLLLFATSPPSFPIKGGRSTCDVVIRRWQVALGVHPKVAAPQKAFIRELNVPHDILRKYPLATRAAVALEAVNFGLPNVARFLLNSKPAGADTELGCTLHQKAFDHCFGDGEVITEESYTEDEPEPPIPLKIDKPLLLKLQESEAILLASQPATTAALFERFNSGGGGAAASVKKPGPNDPPPGHQTRKQALHSIGAASPKEMRVFINDIAAAADDDDEETEEEGNSKPPTHYFCIYYRDNETDRETSSLRCGRAAWYFSRNPALQFMAIHSGFYPRGATKSNCKNLWTVVYAFDPTKLVGPTEYLAALDNELKVAVGVFGAKKRAGDAAKAVKAISSAAAFDDSATTGKRRMPHVGPLLTTADADYASPPREALRIDPVKARPAPAARTATDPSAFRSTAKSDFVPRSVPIKQPVGHASPPRAPETRTFQTTYGSTIANGSSSRK